MKLLFSVGMATLNSPDLSLKLPSPYSPGLGCSKDEYRYPPEKSLSSVDKTNHAIH